MKTLSKIFKGLSSKNDQDNINSQYGNGAVKHDGHSNSTKGHDEVHQKTAYQCPMKCEGDKTYDQPGNCPKCNMKLVTLSSTNSHKHNHGCC